MDADYSLTTKVVAGIPCSIYGLDELLDTGVKEYDLVIALHGRTRDQWQMRLYANYILKKHYETELSGKRGLLVAAIDHRNHGARTVDAQRNRGWEEGNIWHA
ncbi:hypothetical protein KEM55_003540 [Ascosphaera atra]|nr:hypothetical protein KEM55_003540 [Ascosphaera atra]